ncbi:methyltransferase [Glaciecola sp. MH2013]|uniref:methyltransferase n=1 Tax=Glaciecola sp. MH2013 TaxID=2785524 RepID=UPI00189DA19E|nr:methyltransferase [Glaciecola sp. MH2013]MBF7072701.1 methyltransferase [Glaciecola sp. MH2013]
MSLKKKQEQQAKLARQRDTLFDGIANKFDANIYGTTKGQIRHLLLLHYLSPFLNSDRALHVLDAGGGTGMMSLPFCEKAHDVTLCDGSQDILKIAAKRLARFDNKKLLHCDISNLNKDSSFDLVLCHAVLEWVQEPFRLIDDLMLHVKNAGHLSLSFFNKDAALFNNAIWGNFDYIDNGLNVRNQVRLNPHNAQKPAEVLAYISNNYPNSVITHKAGIRCFHDYMQDKTKQNDEFERLLALEKAHGATEPFMWLGKYFHILIRK